MTSKGTRLALGATALTLIGGVASADIIHADDVIINGGSLCVGFDCVNGESFGFDTLRLKENNLRINFADTSTSASFPTADWRIVANDSSNGGGSYLAFEDTNAGRQTFRVDQGAPANALRVDSGGDVGIGTATPVTDIHVASGNTPTLRLEQNGTSGFTPQTWDVAGNEANFFIRDATNGSTLPFRINPGAPTSAIHVEAGGSVGISTSSPSAKLHVNNSHASEDGIRITNTGTNANLLRLEATSATATGVGFIMDPGTGANFWQMTATANENNFRINRTGGSTEFELNQNGNLTISGTLTTGSSTVYPDYVFAPDYQLMPLSEVAAFIDANGHLPKIPTAEEVAVTGMNISEMQVALLEKVEELTLYTLEQQKVIDLLLQERAARQ